MPEGIFSPLHILILLLSAFIVLGYRFSSFFSYSGGRTNGSHNRAQESQFWGVLVGGITDVFSSSILGTPLVIYVMAKFDVSSTSSGHAVTSIVHANLWLYGMQLAVGLSCSAFGGYVAAWIAKRDELLNGLLSSFLCVAIGLYSIFLGKGDQSLLAQILSYAILGLGIVIVVVSFATPLTVNYGNGRRRRRWR